MSAAQQIDAGWLPIETAPMDGTEVLGYREDAGAFLMRYSSCDAFLSEREIDGLDEETLFQKDWFYGDSLNNGRLEGRELPTHWMQLPADPGAASADPSLEAALLTSEDWTVTGPDGRTWTGKTAARAAMAAQRSTIDPDVSLQRILAAAYENDAATKEVERLRGALTTIEALDHTRAAAHGVAYDAVMLARAALAAAPAAPALDTPAPAEQNQCDGCLRKLPLLRGLHRVEGGWPIGCIAPGQAMANGLTEDETSTTKSVSGLSSKPVAPAVHEPLSPEQVKAIYFRGFWFDRGLTLGDVEYLTKQIETFHGIQVKP